MKTAQERRQAFQKDFDALLEKHGASICIEEDDSNWVKWYGGYKHVIEVNQKTIWDGDTVMADGTTFNLDI